MVLDSQVALVTVLSTLDSYQGPICLLGFPHCSDLSVLKGEIV